MNIFHGRKIFSFARTISKSTHPFFPADIGYIAPYPGEDDPEGKVLRLVKVRGSEDKPWQLFADQVKFAVRNMNQPPLHPAELDSFKYEMSIKEGTEGLVHTLTVKVDGGEMFTFVGGVLKLNLKNMRHVWACKTEEFNDTFATMLDVLFG